MEDWKDYWNNFWTFGLPFPTQEELDAGNRRYYETGKPYSEAWEGLDDKIKISIFVIATTWLLLSWKKILG